MEAKIHCANNSCHIYFQLVLLEQMLFEKNKLEGNNPFNSWGKNSNNYNSNH